MGFQIWVRLGPLRKGGWLQFEVRRKQKVFSLSWNGSRFSGTHDSARFRSETSLDMRRAVIAVVHLEWKRRKEIDANTTNA